MLCQEKYDDDCTSNPDHVLDFLFLFWIRVEYVVLC